MVFPEYSLSYLVTEEMLIKIELCRTLLSRDFSRPNERDRDFRDRDFRGWHFLGCRDGAVVGALASHQLMWPGFDSQIQSHIWVEFVGCLLCTERFSAGTPVSPLLKNQHVT